jgi:8-oxo-dGTP pyrophosphatase MutT (NUDIX family)
MPRPLSCGVLVFSGRGELLLCHATGTQRWDIPKGIAEPGETERDAAVRETAEETGLRLAPGSVTELGRFSYLRTKDLHLFAALADRALASDCRCVTEFVDRFGRSRPEMDAFEWVPFADLGGRCGQSLLMVLTRRLNLPAVEAALVARAAADNLGEPAASARGAT